MNPIKVIMERKQYFKFCQAKVEKKICLTKDEFENFLRSPQDYQGFIEENVDQMYMDKEGIYHCLLVTGEGHRDGILVESEGYGYARYTSYVPDAAVLEYDSLSELGARLSHLVDWVVLECRKSEPEENRNIFFETIEEQTGIFFPDDPYLTELLADMLLERPEIKSVKICDDSLKLDIHPEYFFGYGEKQSRENVQTLEELIRTNGTKELYLVHKEDVGFVPIGQISREDLESGALEKFQDLLQMVPVKIQQGAYGKEVELCGASAGRLKELDQFLASYQGEARQGKVPEEKKNPDSMAKKISFQDLLSTRWENLHLVHHEIDYGLPHTIVELDKETLTETGKEAWADVLSAKVERVFHGIFGLQVELSGVKASRLDAFSSMLAGYCSVEDYESWVKETEGEQQMSPVIQKE